MEEQAILAGARDKFAAIQEKYTNHLSNMPGEQYKAYESFYKTTSQDDDPQASLIKCAMFTVIGRAEFSNNNYTATSKIRVVDNTIKLDAFMLAAA